MNHKNQLFNLGLVSSAYTPRLITSCKLSRADLLKANLTASARSLYEKSILADLVNVFAAPVD